MNDLVSHYDLLSYPGGPFGEAGVDAAVEAVRAEAGWHIAPVRTETVLVVSSGGPDLILPSRRVVSVSSAAGGTDFELHPGAVLHRKAGCWPVGVVQVTMTHGYAQIPADLLPLVASRVRAVHSSRDPGLASMTTGPYSWSYFRGGGVSAELPRRYIVRVGLA